MNRILIYILVFFLISCSHVFRGVFSTRYTLPIITVEINNIKVDMIIDTGGGATMIDLKYLDRLGITYSPTVEYINGFGGQQEMMLTSQKRIIFGESVMVGDIYSGDIGFITKKIPVVGVLGIEHITSVNMQIDFSTKSIKTQ